MILSYARVSTQEQANNGKTSLAEQERKNRAIASLRGADLGYEFLTFVDAGVSGTIPLSERPAGKRMLETAKRRDVIVANKLDRLFRSAADALTTAEMLKKKGIDLILIDMGADPVTQDGVAKMFFGVLALVAEFERHRLCERMNTGRQAKKAKGGHTGGSAPYGFKVVGHQQEARLEPFHEEMDVLLYVRDLHDKRGYHERYDRIAGVLNEMGVRTRTGQEFHRQQIRRMIKQDTLIRLTHSNVETRNI